MCLSNVCAQRQPTTKGKRVAQGKLVHAREHVTGKQVDPGQLTQKFASFNYSDGRKDESVDAETLIGPKRTQIEFRGLRKPFKRMAGTTGLEPAASAVTVLPG